MKIFGKNVGLFIKEGTNYIPLICGRSCELSIQTESIETTTASSSRTRSFIPQYNSWTLSFEGIADVETVYYDNTSLKPAYSVDDIITMQLAGTVITARVKAEKGNGGYVIYEGQCFMTSTTFVGADNSMATFNVSLQGSGTLTQSDEIESSLPYFFRYGYQDTDAIPSDAAIQASSSISVSRRDIPVVTFANITPKYLWIAVPITVHVPHTWDDGVTRQSIPGTVFNAHVQSETFKIVMSKIPYQMAGPTQFI